MLTSLSISFLLWALIFMALGATTAAVICIQVTLFCSFLGLLLSLRDWADRKRPGE